MGRIKKITWMKNSTMKAENTKDSKNLSSVFWRTLDTFSKQTAISGISNAGIARSYFRKGCWLLIFAIFGIFTMYGFTNVVHDYLEWPVTTSIYIEHRNQVMHGKLKSSVGYRYCIFKRLISKK